MIPVNKWILYICIVFMAETVCAQEAEYIYSISITEPQKALQLLEVAEQEGTIPSYKIDDLRSCVYQNGLGLYRLAAFYSQKVYAGDSIRNYPEEYLLLLDRMSTQYQEVGNLAESIRYAVEGAELAKRLHKVDVEANMLLLIGINKRQMKLNAEAATYIDRAIGLQETLQASDSLNWRIVDDLLFSYGTKITYALEDSAYQEALDLLPRYDARLEQLKHLPDQPEGLYDMRQSSKYAAFACVFYRAGDWQKAEACYRNYLKTEYARTAEGEAIRIGYLQLSGRYEEALQYIRKEMKRRTDQGETISYDYVDCVLSPKVQVETELRDYQSAVETYRQIQTVLDSLQRRDKESVSLELAALYESQEKDQLIQEQQNALKVRHVFLFFLISMLLLSILFLSWMVRNWHIIRKKNNVLSRQINGLISCQAELLQAKKTIADLLSSREKNEHDHEEKPDREHSDRPIDDGSLFYRLDEYVRAERIFLQPEIDRSALMKYLHLNRNQFAEMMRDQAKTTFNNYINGLKIEYSLSLMKTYPKYTIEAIAEESGFSSQRTYYRVFRDILGMTPTEYKKTMEI